MPARRLAAAALLAAGLWFAPALAEDGAQGRFQLMAVEGGALRLDTATGAMDLCGESGGRWACRGVVAPPVNERDAAGPGPERPNGAGKPAAYRAAEVARLTRALQEIAAIAAAATGDAADVRVRAQGAEARREIDEALAVTDYTLRRVLDLYRTFQDVHPDSAPEARTPPEAQRDPLD